MDPVYSIPFGAAVVLISAGVSIGAARYQLADTVRRTEENRLETEATKREITTLQVSGAVLRSEFDGVKSQLSNISASLEQIKGMLMGQHQSHQ